MALTVDEVMERYTLTRSEKERNRYVTSPDFKGSSSISFKQSQAETIKNILCACFSTETTFIKSYEKNVISELAQKIAAGNPIIISMAGESASGKSTVMEILKKVLEGKKIPYTLLVADNYYVDTTEQVKKAGGIDNFLAKGGFDDPAAVNLDLIREHFEQLKAGRCVYSPHYDFVTHVSTSDVYEKLPTKVILHEGIHALNDKFKDCSDLKIYCETSPEVIKDRWYKRIAKRNSDENSWDTHFNGVKKAAKQFIHPTKDNADMIICGDCSISYIEEFFNKMSQFLY